MNADKKKYFKLFANCIPVKGIKRSIICDLQKGTVRYIPNEIEEILLKTNNNISIFDIKKSYNNKQDKGIDLFFNELEKFGLGFYSNDVEGFVNLSEEWDYPGEISNAIIDIVRKSNHPFKEIVKELDHLNCSNVQLRFFENFNFSEISTILDYFNNSGVRSIQLIILYNKDNTYENWNGLFKKFTRINSFLIYNSPFEEVISKDQIIIENIKSNIIDHRNCGNITTNYFTVNILTFMESKIFNSCLNKKISIDSNGNIKNCPSMDKSYGNLKNTTLKQALEKQGLKKLWTIKKDDIAICKDCEFRHICTDCRAYIENPNDIYSKPLKCGYNPYTTKWEEWSTNPLKSKAIEYYAMQELIDGIMLSSK